MSVIGPRPQLVRDMVFMTDTQRMRHTAKPGLSGLAQVNGRNAISWEDKINWDLYTVYLTTEDYGINSVITSFISTASFIVAFSLFSAVMRFYVDLKEEPEKLKRFYGTISLFVFFSGTAFAVVLTIFRQITSKYLFSGIDYYPFILVALISLVFNCEYTIFDNILRSQQRALKSSICRACVLVRSF